MTRTRIVVSTGAIGTLALVLISAPVASAAGDVFSNIAPAPQTSGGLFGEFPLGNYALDSHFTAVSVGLFSGINVSGVPPMIAYFLANTVWQLTAFLANSLITVFTWAFSLDLLNGSSATNGAGALAPVSAAVQSIYSSVLGPPWLVVAIVITGLWAMWKALVQRRYTETAGALALSVMFVVIALLFVTQPAQTIGAASKWTNEMSAAFLSLTDKGTLDSEQQAKQADADQLFQVLVYDPWVVLQFGGLEHCVTTGTSNSVAVQPLPAAASQQLLSGTEIQTGGKTCINNANKYATHFLQYQPDSDPRNSEYQALTDGKSSELPSSDPTKYQLGPADQPAADAMGENGQYQRLLLSVVIFGGELGVFLLLGVLSAGVILAQIIVLLLLAFSPVALVISVFPGRGHEFFIGWLQRLATFLLRKAIYSLILAVMLAVAAALVDATASLGWLLSFLLQAAFFWAVFLYRHQLTGQLARATTGHDPSRDRAASLASLYYGSRLLRGLRGGRGSSFSSSAAGPPLGDDDPSTGGPGSGGQGGPPFEPDTPPPPPADVWIPEPASPRRGISSVAQLGERTAQIHAGEHPRLALPAPSDPEPGQPGDQPSPPRQPRTPDTKPSPDPPSTPDPAPGQPATAAAADLSSAASSTPDASRPQSSASAAASDDDTQEATVIPAGAGEREQASKQPASASKPETSLADHLRADRYRLNEELDTTDVPHPVAAPEEQEL
jgi:TrbL/VirB6 plasmid conjugal transfer protein